jgi:hypothetical protein
MLLELTLLRYSGQLLLLRPHAELEYSVNPSNTNFDENVATKESAACVTSTNLRSGHSSGRAFWQGGIGCVCTCRIKSKENRHLTTM